jgi:fructose-1,6-bisphosphatase I
MLPEGVCSSSLKNVLCSLSIAAKDLAVKLHSEDIWEFREHSDLNSSGDKQTEQDNYSHQLFMRALENCDDVGQIVSEEANGLVNLGTGHLSVSIDPFDGSKAYEFGIPPGTIFAIFDNSKTPNDFCGARVLAAGVFIYRHSLELLVSIEGTAFRITANQSDRLKEFSPKRSLICANLSNISQWPTGWSNYFSRRVIEQKSKDKHNMRWYGSLAAHVGAIVRTGGIFAYPPDNREGYSDGHLRLVYEAIPVSYLIETLGGKATNGTERILDITPDEFHQKTPFAFGETSMVLELKTTILTAE